MEIVLQIAAMLKRVMNVEMAQLDRSVLGFRVCLLLPP